VGRQDLHDGGVRATAELLAVVQASLKSHTTTHIALLVVGIVCGALFMTVRLKPFLLVTSQEARRVAELLSQLPVDMDVEGMVERAWEVVTHQQLVEREVGAVSALIRRSAGSITALFRTTARGVAFAVTRFKAGARVAPGGGGKRRRGIGRSNSRRPRVQDLLDAEDEPGPSARGPSFIAFLSRRSEMRAKSDAQRALAEQERRRRPAGGVGGIGLAGTGGTSLPAFAPSGAGATFVPVAGRISPVESAGSGSRDDTAFLSSGRTSVEPPSPLKPARGSTGGAMPPVREDSW
jgi:hypothetical protein